MQTALATRPDHDAIDAFPDVAPARALHALPRPRPVAPADTAAPRQEWFSRKRQRTLAKTALGAGLVLLTATAFGSKRMLKAHAVLGFAFVAVSAWHAALYRPKRQSRAG